MNPTSRIFLNFFQVFNITVLIIVHSSSSRSRQDFTYYNCILSACRQLVLYEFICMQIFSKNSFEFSQFFFNFSTLLLMIMMSSAILGSSRAPFQLRTILPSWVWIFILPLFTCIVEFFYVGKDLICCRFLHYSYTIVPTVQLSQKSSCNLIQCTGILYQLRLSGY